MDPQEYEVFRVLRATGADARQTVALPGGLAFALWGNESGHAIYDRPGHHALSVYLEGGEKTARLERGRSVGHGYPGAVCVFPAHGRSEWRIHAPFRFLHFYFRDEHLARTIARVWDREPAARSLQPQYLFASPAVHNAARLILSGDWTQPASALALDHLGQWLLLYIAQHHTNRMQAAPAVRGTLAPAAARRIRELIDARLAEPLSLEQLAAEVHLSPYHFARLFRATFGEPPYRFVLARRMERARNLLRETDDKIVAIALSCGFSDHSQFARAFRRHYGVSPSEIRAARGSTPVESKPE
ncbi:MAG TPA: AraC family transcriptional regulator [Arenicellales bacterium]|nr:AraC family transcriptional regulator [Arenicellales bacterium]